MVLVLGSCYAMSGDPVWMGRRRLRRANDVARLLLRAEELSERGFFSCLEWSAQAGGVLDQIVQELLLGDERGILRIGQSE